MFQNCDGGVYVKRSNVVVTNAKFSEVKTGVEVERSRLHRVWVTNNRFSMNDYPIKMLQNAPLLTKGRITANRIISVSEENVGIGIYESIPTSANQSWSIANNEISILGNTAKGISINSAENVTINNNDINISHAFTSNYTGIYIAGSTSTTVSCNNISNQVNFFSPNGVGIQVFQSPSTTLDCNATIGTNIGINYWGMCDNSETKGNGMQDNSVGLLYGLFPAEGNAFTGPQDDQGNIWNGDFEGDGALHLGASVISDLSKYIVDSDEDSGFLPIWDAEGDWFQNDPDQDDTYSCKENETCGSSKRIVRSNNLEEIISLGKLPTKGYDKSLNWTGQQHLYRRMANDITSRELYKEFYAKQDGSEFTRLTETFRELESLYSVEKYNNQEWARKQEELIKSFEEIVENQTAFFSTDDNVSRTELLEIANRKIVTLNDLQTRTTENEQRALLEEERQMQLRPIAENSDDVYMQNWVDVQKIIENNINDYTVVFSETDIKTLTMIANQCILSGGDAVLVARSLLAETGNFTYDEVELCSGAKKREEDQKIESQSSISVYPNPAQQVINVSFNNFDSGRVVLTLRNTLGSIVHERTITSNATTEQLSLNDSASGIYFLEVEINGERKHVEKVLIVK